MIWLPEHVHAFMAVAPVELQRALILALHTGQRQGDILALSWNNYDGALISLRQSKGDRKVEVPCTKALRAMLDGMARTSSVTLTTKTGRPWQSRHITAEWAKAAAEAKIADLHFHDLSGTAVTMLAEARCTVPQIAAIRAHPQGRDGDPGPLHGSYAGAGGRGCGAVRERTEHTVCRPSANRKPSEVEGRFQVIDMRGTDAPARTGDPQIHNLVL